MRFRSMTLAAALLLPVAPHAALAQAPAAAPAAPPAAPPAG
ncbi:formate dehydrogenase, partial [Dankookia rubra]